MEPATNTDFFFRLFNPEASEAESITPESFNAKEVGELLLHLEATFKAFIESYPELNVMASPKEGVISLVEVRNASLGLGFKPFNRYAFAIALNFIAGALETDDFESLPPKCVEHLQAVQKIAKSKSCEGQLFLDGRKRARIRPDADISLAPIPESIPIRGETTLYGQVTRVGGGKPTAQVVFESGESLTCMVTRSLAIQLGSSLYSKVALKGVAAWSSTDYKLIEFRIESFVKFQPLAPQQAFEKLRESLGPYWDKIEDVDNYLFES